MLSVTFVKKPGAPAGTFRINTAGHAEVVLDDGANTSFTTTDSDLIQLLDGLSQVQRDGETDVYVPPTTTAPLDFIQDSTPLQGDILTRTERGYEFEKPFWAAPVAALEDLPTTGNNPGEVRIVLANFTIRVWNGSAWILAAGAGGGGVIPGTESPVNLFIQQTQPTLGEMTIDSLWIPIDGSGVPAGPEDWQVYTGTGDGDGGNLVISSVQPVSPDVDTLWVALNGNGTPKDFYSWRVFSGTGSVEGYGQPNLFFAVNQPSVLDSPTGSLWVPLNSNQTPKTMDTWRVLA